METQKTRKCGAASAVMSQSPRWTRRLKEELYEFDTDTVPYCTAGPKSLKDPYHWEAVVRGPPNTPYEGGAFMLDVHLPADYPMSPPQIQFATPIFHCNVHPGGGVCLNLLGCEWSPVLSIKSVLLSVVSLLIDPEEDPFFLRKDHLGSVTGSTETGKHTADSDWSKEKSRWARTGMVSDEGRQRLFQTDRAKHDSIAREWTQKLAMSTDCRVLKPSRKDRAWIANALA